MFSDKKIPLNSRSTYFHSFQPHLRGTTVFINGQCAMFGDLEMWFTVAILFYLFNSSTTFSKVKIKLSRSTHLTFLQEFYYLSQGGNSTKTIKLCTDTQDYNNPCTLAGDIKVNPGWSLQSAISVQHWYCHSRTQSPCFLVQWGCADTTTRSSLDDHRLDRAEAAGLLYTHHTDSQCSIHHSTINM